MSSVWNFCSFSSHIISHRNSCGILKMSAAFSGYPGIGLSSYPRKKTQATTECHPPRPRTPPILFTMGYVDLDIGRHSSQCSGRCSGRHSVDSRSIVGRQSVDTRSALGQDTVDSRSRCALADIAFHSPTLHRHFSWTLHR